MTIVVHAVQFTFTQLTAIFLVTRFVNVDTNSIAQCLIVVSKSCPFSSRLFKDICHVVE